jgi:hypothetical protein
MVVSRADFAPAKKDADKTIVYGVNDKTPLNSRTMSSMSNASLHHQLSILVVQKFSTMKSASSRLYGRRSTTTPVISLDTMHSDLYRATPPSR